MLCDRLEARLKGSAFERLLQRVFAGKLAHQLIKADDAACSKESLEPFFCIRCVIQAAHCCRSSPSTLTRARASGATPWPSAHTPITQHAHASGDLSPTRPVRHHILTLSPPPCPPLTSPAAGRSRPTQR